MAVLLATLLLDTYPAAALAATLGSGKTGNEWDCFQKQNYEFSFLPLATLPLILILFFRTIKERDVHPRYPRLRIFSEDTILIKLFGASLTSLVMSYVSTKFRDTDICYNPDSMPVYYPLLLLALLPLEVIAAYLARPYRYRGPTNPVPASPSTAASPPSTLRGI